MNRGKHFYHSTELHQIQALHEEKHHQKLYLAEIAEQLWIYGKRIIQMLKTKNLNKIIFFLRASGQRTKFLRNYLQTQSP